MNALGRFMAVFFTGQDPDGERPALPVGDADEPFETGKDLTSRIEEAIRARRPVLVTGPRGSGKSRCCEDAIKNVRGKAIRGKFFLQGNREIPREYLSEDMLVLDRAGKPRLLKALALRTGEDEAAMEQLDRAAPTVGGAPAASSQGVNAWPAGGQLVPQAAPVALAVVQAPSPAPPIGAPAKRAEYQQRFASCFPALPANEVSRDELADIWTNDDWSVLYLDEINRFGDGFLDALLSLLEEGKIVRRGHEYYVPLTVVATANPPGYDITAKKLSPPLQARIARSFRVAQPSLGTLVNPILSDLVNDVLRNRSLDGSIRTVLTDPGQEPWLRRVAATVLCLWGDPTRGLPGHSFLTVATRDLLKALAAADARLGAAMRDLCDLSLFGPDARSAGAWYLAAAGRAATGPKDGAKLELRPEHLLGTVRETLNNKLRENFNEGTEPEKTIRKELLIHRIASRLIKDKSDPGEFPTLSEQLAKQAIEQLVMGERSILADLGIKEDAMQQFLSIEDPPEAEKDEHRRRRRWLLVVGAFPAIFNEGRVDGYLRPLERLLEGLQLLPDDADPTGGAAASESDHKFLTTLVSTGTKDRGTARKAAVDRVFHTFGLATTKP